MVAVYSVLSSYGKCGICIQHTEQLGKCGSCIQCVEQLGKCGSCIQCAEQLWYVWQLDTAY